MPRWFLLSLSSGCIIASATPYQPLSLNAAVQLALRFNPQVQIAGLQRLTQKMGLDIIRNQTEWQYALNATSQYAWSSDEQASSARQVHQLQSAASRLWSSGTNTTLVVSNVMINPNGSHNPSSYNPQVSFNINQPLLRGFGKNITLSPLANAEDQARIERLQRQQTIIDTIVTVAIDYENDVLAQQNLAIQNTTLTQVSQRLHDLTIEIEAGIMPPADRIQAEADVANARFNANTAQYQVSQSHLQLLNDIGIAPNTPLEIDPQQRVQFYGLPSSADSMTLALANDSAYQSSLINRRIDQRREYKAIDDQRPQLNMVISGTTASSTNANHILHPAQQTATIGLSLSIPIDNVALHQQYLNAKVQLAEDDINIRRQRWQLQSAVINALHNLNALQHQWQLAQQAVTQQQKTLVLAQQRLHFGMGSALDISIQQKNLTQAQLIASGTQIAYFIAWLQFRQLIGKTLQDFGVRILN